MGDWQGEWSCCLLAGSESWSESLELVGDGDADAADVQVSMDDMIPPVSMPSQPVLVLFVISGPHYISLAVLWLRVSQPVEACGTSPVLCVTVCQLCVTSCSIPINVSGTGLRLSQSSLLSPSAASGFLGSFLPRTTLQAFAGLCKRCLLAAGSLPSVCCSCGVLAAFRMLVPSPRPSDDAGAEHFSSLPRWQRTCSRHWALCSQKL